MDNNETPLTNGAVLAHETFLAFRQAGFTEHQALYLVSQIMANAQIGDNNAEQ